MNSNRKKRRLHQRHYYLRHRLKNNSYYKIVFLTLILFSREVQAITEVKCYRPAENNSIYLLLVKMRLIKTIVITSAVSVSPPTIFSIFTQTMVRVISFQWYLGTHRCWPYVTWSFRKQRRKQCRKYRKINEKKNILFI